VSKRPDEERHLLRPFNDDVRREKGAELAEAVHQIQQLDAQAKRIAAEFKEQIKKHETKALALKDDLRMGKHLVPVQCQWLMSTNTWELIARDTGEVIRTEPTSMADRQGELLS
jgi:hypothetical protein